MSSTFTSFIV